VAVQTDRIAAETLKLLVKIARADNEVSIEELNFILTAAERAGITAEETDALRSALTDGQPLPEADLALLRQHRDDVLRSVDLLISMDDRIVDNERAARDEIERLLR